jgi:hypothetical protein
MNVSAITDLLDQYMIEKGKRELSLRTANEVILQQPHPSLPDGTLKSLLVTGQIPHAYQTSTPPRLWYIPFSAPGQYTERRKAYLAGQRAADSVPAPDRQKTPGTNPVAIYGVIAIVAGLLYLLFAKEPTTDGVHSLPSSAPSSLSTTTTFSPIPLQVYTLRSTLNDHEVQGSITQTNRDTTFHIFDFIHRTVTLKAPMGGRLLTFSYPMRSYYIEKGVLASTYVIVVNDNGVKEIWFSPDVPNLGYDYLDGSRQAYYVITLLDSNSVAP